MKQRRKWRACSALLSLTLAMSMAMPAMPAVAAPGDSVTTLVTPPELPVEVETELAPAGSLKQAPLWKEIIQLLEDPYAPVVRRPGFGSAMPALNVWEFERNTFLDEPLRLRTSDGEISFDHAGFLFDPDQYEEDGGPTPDLDPDGDNVPNSLRTVIGSLVMEDATVEIDGEEHVIPSGNLVVDNPDSDLRIPPDGTVVAVPAFIDGAFHEYDPATGDREEILEFDIPVNETDFLRDETDVAGVPAVQQEYIGRPAAEVLGKSLFWDMQVGSDGVQACGTCHFSAGVDSRSRNQLNPNHLGNDTTLQVAGSDATVIPADFPFRKLSDVDLPSEGDPNQTVIRDHNDIMSSMGVKFRDFADIPPIGAASFGVPIGVDGPRPLLPDLSAPVADPIAAFVDPDTGENLRRVEPRNTPTMQSAAFNFDSFWDGRARHDFNGGSVQGATDPEYHIFVDPGTPGGPLATSLQPGDMVYFRPELEAENPEMAEQPVRILLSSLGSQAVGPPLSDFEMSFRGRNWAKIGKKLLQQGGDFSVTPLANQIVDPDDSVLGPFSGQRSTIGGPVDRPGRTGLNTSYNELIRLAFRPDLWQNTSLHLNGSPSGDPFDGYSLDLANGPASTTNRNQFTQMEANFSLFFGLGVQMYEQLLIPDDSPFDQFMDANPNAANGVGQPGERGTLEPWQVDNLVGELTMIPDDPTTPEYDGFGEDELFGFDIFAGANLTAALPDGSARNPMQVNGSEETTAVGSNPFLRSARCMLCHLGPEQTDASINISTGSLISNTEYEFPTPPDMPEATGRFAVPNPLMLADEFEGPAPDVAEVEPRDMQVLNDPDTPYDDRIVSVPSGFAIGDQGIYNIGLRPVSEDIGRGDNDVFGWPLSLAALALKNLGGVDFEPQDTPDDPTPNAGEPMPTFDPDLGPEGGLFEESGGDAEYPGAPGYTLQSINPGVEPEPTNPLLPDYVAPWANWLGGGELHPDLDELAAAPNTITEANGGPNIEFPEITFGADLHTGVYDPLNFGSGAPNYGWGPLAPNSQSGVPNNYDGPLQGTWPFANRVGRNGAFKAPQLRNVELTGPYFHTGSYLTLRQVVDFYMRGGDFPVTNAEVRDQHIVDLEEQAFGFGTTRTESNGGPIPDVPFADGLSDNLTQYDKMPDTDHDQTPEPAQNTPEAAKVALVKFLLSLTDQRVRYDRAPFDRPEIFVPLDGTAPDNTGGRAQLVADSRFLHLEAVGEDGRETATDAFLGVSREMEPEGQNTVVDHFDGVSDAVTTVIGIGGVAAAVPAALSADTHAAATVINIPHAGSAIISGTLSNSGGAIANREVVLEALVGGVWIPQATVLSDTNGFFSKSVSPITDTTYRWRFPADGAVSESVDVRPAKLTTLTLSGPSTVGYKKSGLLKGVLAAVGSGPLSGQPIAVQAKPAGTSAWKTVATVNTGTSGAWSASVSPTKRTQYRAVYGGVPNFYEATASGVKTISPKAYLTRPTAPSKVYKNRYFTTTGVFKPRPGSKSVKIKAYKWSSSKQRYVFVKTYTAKLSKVNSSTTRYRARIKFTSRGKWRIRAYTPASTQNAATYSAYRTKTVR